ncbi:MAG: extracellular solute-binding protein [Gammaproteobacteria bacterium]|nr:extracellular solute-binding protein [Gammaproteobacteria bacterium]
MSILAFSLNNSVKPMQPKLVALLMPFFLLIFLIFNATTAHSAQINIAAIERQPYSGADLPEQGYVNDLITEVFQAAGITANIQFYPLARAIKLLHTGEIDAIAPILDTGDDNLLYSMGFPGAVPVLMKKKTSDDPPLQRNIKEKITVAMLRGTTVLPAEIQALSVHPVYVTEEQQGLGMLANNRVDYTFIDKYTAANIIVNQRPDLIGKFEFIPLKTVKSQYHLGFSGSNAKGLRLKALFEKHYNSLLLSGRVTTLLNKHGFYQANQVTQDTLELVFGAVDINLVKRMQLFSKQYQHLNPSISIQWRVMDENTLRARLMADYALSGGEFDIVMIGDYEARTWGGRGWLEPLPIKNELLNSSDFLPVVKERLFNQPFIYAYPLQSETSITYYRKDLLQAKGITMPENPSYADIVKVAAAVHNPKQGVYGLGLRGLPGWGQNMAFVTVLVNSYGGRWFDDKWKPLLQSDSWHNAISFYVETLKKYGPPAPAEMGWKENLELFAAGNLAISIDATTAVSRLFDQTFYSNSHNVGFANHPVAKQHVGAKWYWGWNVAVPESSRKKVEAIKFANWLASEKNINQMIIGNTPTPIGARFSSFDVDFGATQSFANFVLAQLDPTTESTVAGAPTIGDQYIAIPEFPAIGNTVGLLISKALKGEITVEQALKQAQQDVETIMRNAGYYSPN